MVQFIIRSEIRDKDEIAIGDLHRAAFGKDAPGVLVDGLRHFGHDVVSLVAETDGKIVGHILFSRLEAPLRALVLGPVAADPTLQRSGIGSSLIEEGLRQAREQAWQAVFVLGSPAYYERFGFAAAVASAYTAPYSGPHFMAQILDDAAPKTGVITFPSAFAEDIRHHTARRLKMLERAQSPKAPSP